MISLWRLQCHLVGGAVLLYFPALCSAQPGYPDRTSS